MVRRITVSYAEAVKLLAKDRSALVDALDQVLGLGLLAVTTISPANALPYFDAKNELIARLSRLTNGLKERAQKSSRIEYDNLLAAAHAVIVMASFSEEVTDRLRRLDEDGKWQRELRRRTARVDGKSLGGRSTRRLLVDWATQVVVAPPGPTRPFENIIAELNSLYRALSRQALTYVQGLRRWDALNTTEQARVESSLRSQELVDRAIDRYKEHYLKLAAEIPEFLAWTVLNEAAATRRGVKSLVDGAKLRDTELRDLISEIRVRLTDLDARLQSDATALGGLPALLAELATREVSGSKELQRRISACHRVHQLVLRKPLLTPRLDGDLSLIQFPTIEKGYINPDFRLYETTRSDEGKLLAQEQSWKVHARRTGLGGFLAAYLRSAKATAVPLLVLGDPGSGKSLLSKIIAAQLPPTEFAVARVELRHVRASQEVGDQIDLELQRQTNNRYRLHDLTDRHGQFTRVAIMDGLDELLQLSPHQGLGYYLERLADFQEVEAELGRPVIAIATARTIVMDRIFVPASTIAVKLEDFTDDQINVWIDIWNHENARHFRRYGLTELAPDTVARHAELARQPLLLALLALYDAEGNHLRDAGDLSRAELYERIFRRYLEREIEKEALPARHDERQPLVEQRFRELSTIATGMLNRGRRFITRQEVERDYDAIGIGRTSTPHGQIVKVDDAVGQFFFLYRAQAQHQETTFYEGYEFIHSTFGEFLAARIVAHQLARAIEIRRHAGWDRIEAERHALSLLIPYLAQRPLVGEEQVLLFLENIIGGLVGNREAAALVIADHVPSLLKSGVAGGSSHDLVDRGHLERLSVLSLNLVLASLRTAGSGLRLEAFCSADQDPITAWRQLAGLWRSYLAIDDWDRVLSSLILTDSDPLLLSIRDGSGGSERVEFESVLGGLRGTSSPGRLVAEGRLINDSELVGAVTLWSLVRRSLAHFQSDDTLGTDWLVAAAAFRVSPTGRGRADSSKIDYKHMLREVVERGSRDSDLIEIILGGPAAWTNELLTLVATYVAERGTLMIKTRTLLDFVSELDSRGLASSARRLLGCLSEIPREPLHASDVARIVGLSRRHQWAKVMSQTFDLEQIDDKVLDWLTADDLAWVIECREFPDLQIARLVKRLRSSPRYKRMSDAIDLLAARIR